MNLNRIRVKKLVSDTARNYKVKHVAVDSIVYCITSHWDRYNDLDWFKVSSQRARLLLNDPAPTTVVLAVALDTIKNKRSYYFEPITDQEMRDELNIRTEDTHQQIPAAVLSATDIGRYRE